VKTIGLIGGTSWVSTLEYYRLLNEGVNVRLGGVEAARCIVYSFNFGEIARLKAGDPEQRRVRPLVVAAARCLETAGADGLVLCANTLHMFADSVAGAVAIPVIHVADAAAAAVRAAGASTVGLLGTRATMEQGFYRDRLAAAGIATLVPDAADRAFMDDAIMTELVRGVFRPDVKQRFLDVIGQSVVRGAEGVILGCTEIPLLLQADTAAGVPLFDTLAIHARAAVDFALGGPGDRSCGESVNR